MCVVVGTLGSGTPGTLQISGSGAVTITVGSTYQFTPVVTGSVAAQRFSVSNLPVWASFDAATGTLRGTPTSADVGTYANIAITVIAGSLSAQLAPFTFTVSDSASATGTGTATLSWTAPTQNTDDSALTDLAGFRVYYGSSAGQLNDVVQLPDPTTTTYTVRNLPSGTSYFAVTAYNSAGVESAHSNTGSKVIP